MRLITLLGSLALASAVQAAAMTESPALNVQFIQNNQPVVLQTNAEGTITVALQAAPFDIHFPDTMINGCASHKPAINDSIKLGADAMQDFNACLFIYKSVAMADDATYLFLSDDGGFSLNPSHGATRLSDKRSAFHVTHLEHNGKPVTSTDIRAVSAPLYLIFWIDRNKNNLFEAGEVERYTLHFTPT